jgi:hypothetical protein
LDFNEYKQDFCIRKKGKLEVLWYVVPSKKKKEEKKKERKKNEKETWHNSVIK